MSGAGSVWKLYWAHGSHPFLSLLLLSQLNWFSAHSIQSGTHTVCMWWVTQWDCTMCGTCPAALGLSCTQHLLQAVWDLCCMWHPDPLEQVLCAVRISEQALRTVQSSQNSHHMQCGCHSGWTLLHVLPIPATLGSKLHAVLVPEQLWNQVCWGRVGVCGPNLSCETAVGTLHSPHGSDHIQRAAPGAPALQTIYLPTLAYIKSSKGMNLEESFAVDSFWN